ELAGVVTALGYGTTGLSVGQRVFGLSDSYRGGTLAEYAAVEARNLAPLPGDVDFTVGASVAMPGLTAWQGLFVHGRLQAGQSVLVHGAAGAVGSMVTQLAREAGAYVIGTGRAADRQKAFDFGAKEFVDLENDALEDVGRVHLVFDVIGGDIGKVASATPYRVGYEPLQIAAISSKFAQMTSLGTQNWSDRPIGHAPSRGGWLFFETVAGAASARCYAIIARPRPWVLKPRGWLSEKQGVRT